MIQIPEAAVEAAAKSILEYQRPNRPWDGWAPAGKDMWREVASAALEAAAPHMLAKAKEAAEPVSHWIVNRDTGWGCDGCDWTGANLKEYWDAHGKPDEYKIPF